MIIASDSRPSGRGMKLNLFAPRQPASSKKMNCRLQRITRLLHERAPRMINVSELESFWKERAARITRNDRAERAPQNILCSDQAARECCLPRAQRERKKYLSNFELNSNSTEAG